MNRNFEKSKTFIREVKHGRKAMNHNNDRLHGKTENERDKPSSNSAQWIPHPRTGIYYPKGHESVLETVPKGAASLSTTCWFRNFEGTEHAFADPIASAVFDHPFVN